MEKQRLGMTCILAMLLTMSTFLHPVQADTSFTDRIPVWALDAVDYLVEKGVIDGVGGNQFAPNKELTRGEASKIIALTLELDVNMNEKTNLIDAKDHWASPYIKAIQTGKSGVIDGYPDGTFKPNEFVTREEMTKMMVLAYGLEEDTNQSVQFDDVSGWAADYIGILASLGIIEGKGEGLFAPKEPVNRAQAAVMIHRAEVVLPIMISPEFTDGKTAEQDGIHFEVMLSQMDAKLYAKVKATNVSGDTIPYVGYDGCDRGLSAELFAESEDGEVQVGSKWSSPVISCNLAVWQYFLEPGETIEELEILSPPTEGLKENHYVKVKFQKGLLDSTSPSIPIEIEIPIELE